jgi:hypothetical protein
MSGLWIRPRAVLFTVLSLAALLASGLESQSDAGFVMITSQNGLSANGSFNLANLGAEGTNVPLSYELTSNSSIKAQFSQKAGSAFRVNESSNWDGNFAANEALIWTRYGGPVQVDFGTTKLKTFGVQIQPDIFGPFSAYVSVLDSSGTELARFSLDGNSTNLHDGSALFIGVGSDDTATNFSRVQIGLNTGGNPFNFAYNGPSFQSIPEPTTWVLTGITTVYIAYLYSQKRVSGQKREL